jgi:hypothetical protein
MKNALIKVFNLVLLEDLVKRGRLESLKGGTSRDQGRRDMITWTILSPRVANPRSQCAEAATYEH